jgi:hypothetical protein
MAKRKRTTAWLTITQGSYRIAKNDKKKKPGIFKIMYSLTSDIVY